MAESSIVSVIRVWAAVAWADGVLAQAEADGLRRLIGSAELLAEERVAALKLLDAKVDLPYLRASDIDPEARNGIYRAACRIAIVDHVFAHAEREMLDRLQRLLGIPADIAREIEADVPGFEV